MSDGLIKTPMTEEEKQAALALLRCSFLPASFDKRFSHDMAALARSEDTGITDKQRTCLWKLVYRYRRQMKDPALVAVARERSDGQRSLGFKEPEPAKNNVLGGGRIRHRFTDFLEQELFNGFPEDNF